MSHRPALSLGHTAHRRPAARPEPAADSAREAAGAAHGGGEGLSLSLSVHDPEVVAALEALPPGPAREAFARTALRIGVLALRQAEGRLDSEALRQEGERWMGELARQLAEHERSVREHVGGTLREYFDPGSGRFSERVERLVRKDGELERLLHAQVGREDSELGRTLAHHLGDRSPLMQWLGPDASSGLLAALGHSVDEALDGQRQRILAEFSLDNREGALSRLVQELSERHGALGRELASRIDEVVGEFSLDDENSALSRLVGRVEKAQAQISAEFSLDQEGAALARMRRELLEVLDAHREGNARFQAEVREALVAMKARREESERSTRHGEDFEAEVFAFAQRAAQHAGDVAHHVGASVGAIRNCKKGDVLVELGPESAAAGARIVLEAKEDRSFDLGRARAECDEARKNRRAGVALFVFSRRTAPEGLAPFGRYGADVVVTWDPEDPSSDVFLEAGLSVAKALSTRAASERDAHAADFAALDRAIHEIERQARGLDEIRTAAETVRSGAERILHRARIVRDGLARQVGSLEETVGLLRREGAAA